MGTRDGLIIKFSQQKLNTNNSFEFYAGCLYAKNQWKPALGINFTDTVLMSSANLKMYGGSASDLRKIGFTPGSENGLTWDDPDTLPLLVQMGMYNGVEYPIYRVYTTKTYVVDKNQASNQVRNTCTHEMGHALGWYGHSIYGGDVMTEYANTVQGLTPHDIGQLAQVY